MNTTDFLECNANWTGPVAGESSPLSTDSAAAGYAACAIASVLFGSNFVPFKFIATKDGFFTQWVMCTGIFIVGLAMQLVREQPLFFPWTLMGGAIWCLGNCCTVPIINLIGLSIGMLVWNCSNVLLGWAASRFGWFGLCAAIPSDEVMNYIGVAMCVIAGGIYILVKTETTVTLPDCLSRKMMNRPEEATSISGYGNDTQFNTNSSAAIAVGAENHITSGEQLVKAEPEDKDSIFLPNLPPTARRILGISLSLAAGCCYGVQFNFATYIQNHTVVNGVRASQNGLDYVFSQFCGIFLASTVAFGGYLVVNGKSAFVNANIVLPALVSGIMWGIATCCFFLANSTLSPAITFPIIATVPGMIATLWGIFLFREIRGLRNFLILGVAFSLTIGGAILTALSK